MVYLLLHFIYLFLLLHFKAVFTQYLADTLFYISYFFTNVYVNSILYPFLYDYVLQMLYFKVLYLDIWRYTNKSYYYYYLNK